MSDNAAQCLYQTKVLRFTVGVGLAVLFASLLNWPLAFGAPIFTAKFLIDKPRLNKETVYELLLAMVVTFAFGLLLSGSITQYPLVLLICVGLMMLWGYYLFTDPQWNLFATFLIIAVLMLPFMAIETPKLSLLFAFGLSGSGVVALAIFALVHLYLPDPIFEIESESKFDALSVPILSQEVRYYSAFRALLISFPVVCFFFVFQISQALLTMAFIALLSLMITADKSVHLSRFLLRSNGIGGLIAIVSFFILSLVPNIIFYTAYMSLLAILMGAKIYQKPAKAPVLASAFNSVLVLLGSTLMSGGDIDNNVLIRLSQLMMVAAYMILAAYFLETRDWKFLQFQRE
jgi:hypothetical protein